MKKIEVTCEVSACEMVVSPRNGFVEYHEARIEIAIEDPCGWAEQDEETRDHLDRDIVQTVCVFKGTGYEDKGIAMKELRAAAFAILKPEVYASIAVLLDDDKASEETVVVTVEGEPWTIATRIV
jgi:hypothetical protein